MGNPLERDPSVVARDVKDGLVGVAAALNLYKVVVSADGTLDATATEQARAGG
jgi:N-methylhydantoinase B